MRIMLTLMVGFGILVPFERTTDGLEENEGFVSRNFIIDSTISVEFGSACVCKCRLGVYMQREWMRVDEWRGEKS